MGYFFDTNVIYYVTRNSENKKINNNKLLNMIKNNVCFVSMYSLFEILNNEHIDLKDFRSIYKELIAKVEGAAFYTDQK